MKNELSVCSRTEKSNVQSNTLRTKPEGKRKRNWLEEVPDTFVVSKIGRFKKLCAVAQSGAVQKFLSWENMGQKMFK